MTVTTAYHQSDKYQKWAEHTARKGMNILVISTGKHEWKEHMVCQLCGRKDNIKVDPTGCMKFWSGLSCQKISPVNGITPGPTEGGKFLGQMSDR